jgi:hypothetical protein
LGSTPDWATSRQLAEVGALIERSQALKPGLKNGGWGVGSQKSAQGHLVRKPHRRLHAVTAIEARQVVVEPIAYKRQGRCEQVAGLQHAFELGFRQAAADELA